MFFFNKNKIVYGKPSPYVIKRVLDIFGLDISNRYHVLSIYDFIHIIKAHGLSKKEIMRGQLPINYEDIYNIASVLNNPDFIIKGNNNKLGPTIKYIKKYDNNYTYAVEVIPNNSKTLIIKTMWKKCITLTNRSTLSSTSKTKGNFSSTSTYDVITISNRSQDKGVEV